MDDALRRHRFLCPRCGFEAPQRPVMSMIAIDAERHALICPAGESD